MDNKLLIPSSIVLAAVIIAGAVLYTNMPASPNQPGDNAGKLPANSGDALKVRKDDFILGNPAAKVVLVEYGDFQCPFCGKFFKTTEKQLVDIYIKQGKAVLVWRDFAFLGEESFRAAEAARCAGEQNKFWEYHDYLFNNQRGENEGAFADTILKSFAKTLKLDEDKFNTCFDSGKYRKAVEASGEEGRIMGVNGTPATFVNGQLISGAVSFITFQSAIEAELKK